MDKKPFQAQLDRCRAHSRNSKLVFRPPGNLARVKPLAAQNALSQKDLDDAVGQEQAVAAAVETAKAEVVQAQLNLSYCTIASPVTGCSYHGVPHFFGVVRIAQSSAVWLGLRPDSSRM